MNSLPSKNAFSVCVELGKRNVLLNKKNVIKRQGYHHMLYTH